MAFVDELRGWVVSAAIAKGCAPELAAEIADYVEQEARIHGGRSTYLHAPCTKKRDDEIKRRHTGTGESRDDLCTEFGISRTTFYRIIATS